MITFLRDSGESQLEAPLWDRETESRDSILGGSVSFHWQKSLMQTSLTSPGNCASVQLGPGYHWQNFDIHINGKLDSGSASEDFGSCNGQFWWDTSLLDCQTRTAHGEPKLRAACTVAGRAPEGSVV
jgi:hypothetical protein